MWHDLRFALRLMRKDFWFTAAAVIALALGLGANSTVFTIANAVLLRGLPFPESDRLVEILGTTVADGEDTILLSHADWHDWRAQSRSFEGLAAFRTGGMNVSETSTATGARAPVRVRGMWASADTFPLLRTQPILGRTFRPDDDQPGAERVVILSHRLWQNRYGGDRAVLGRTISVNEQPATIVGVMPDGMEFHNNTELWQPLVPTTADARRDRRELVLAGRLRAGVTAAQAKAELSGIARQLAQRYPDSNRQFDAAAVNSFTNVGGTIRVMMGALLGAVGFVLLIACANVANLLLSRSTFRAREMAVRAALGATRRRLLRQLLIESLLMALTAGAIGLLLALVGVRLFDLAVADTGKPYWLVFTMDWHVFAYVASICLFTALAFGLAPALQVSGLGLESVLRDSGRTQVGGRRTRRLTSFMVVTQVALTLTLLTAAGLMGRSLLSYIQLDLGLDSARVVTMGIGLAEAKYDTPQSRLQFHDRLIARLHEDAAVAAASVATSTPGGPANRLAVEVDGRPVRDQERAPQTRTLGVGDRYFDALGVALRVGRVFDQRDGSPGAEAAIVNERFVTRLFAGQSPIGQRIRLVGDPKEPGPWLTIVGVSPTILQGDLQQPDPEPVVYVPYRQNPGGQYAVIVRPAGTMAAGDATGLARAIQQAVVDVDPNQPIDRLRTLSASLAAQRWPYRVFGSLFGIFAVIALLLSAVGLYAVSAYAVSRRRQEIGVRMALGAQPVQVVWQVLRTGLLQLACGVALGLAGAWGVGQVLKTLLFRVSTIDPVTFFGLPVLLLAVTIAACWIPARRAARIDPVAALRAD